MSRPIKPAVDSRHTQPWLEPIGKLAVNFGAIELHTYWWLGALAGDPGVARGALRKPFTQRVGRITELLRTRIDDAPLRDEALAARQEAESVAEFRNAILHNPLVFGWHSLPETGSPDLIGIPDVAHVGSKPRITKPIAALADIIAAVNREVLLVQALDQLLARLDAILAAKSERPWTVA